VRDKSDTAKLMLDVIIALIPSCAVGVYYFGFAAFRTVALCMVFCVVSEYLINLFLKRRSTIGDLSALVTGLLLGMNLPPDVPFWVPVLGSVFAICLVKAAFGGIGFNFVNPALAARAFLVASFPGIMTKWIAPLSSVDAVSTATPLFNMSTGASALGFAKDAANAPTFGKEALDLFLGLKGGCIGEVCIAALVLGGVYLVARKVISWHIPVIYIATVFVGTVLFSSGYYTDGSITGAFKYGLMQILSGGLFIGAIFMATDYTTSPMTKKGKVVYALGCGLLTSIIRLFGGYPEGVSFSILIMNLFVPLIDRAARTRTFGHRKVKQNA
jgi:electron transport complex protein RnfD